MIKATLIDGAGSSRVSRVTAQNALTIAEIYPDVPAIGTPNRYRFFAQYLTDNGLPTGNHLFNVNGSVTPALLKIIASEDYDIHITHLVIIIADSLIFHNKFGNIPALTNGFSLYAVESGNKIYLLDHLKTGGQLIAHNTLYMAYGDGATVNELTNWTGTEDAQTIVFPLYAFIPGGFRIGRRTTDKLECSVEDDLTGLTEAWVKAFGYKHYPGLGES